MASNLVGAPQKWPVPFNVVVATGTTAAAPQRTAMSLQSSWVYEIEIEVPKGPAGAMGFYLEYAGKPVIPWANNASFLVVDDYEKSFDVSAEMGQGLVCVCYNTGGYSHTIYFRVMLTPISAYNVGANTAPVYPLDLSQIGS